MAILSKLVASLPKTRRLECSCSKRDHGASERKFAGGTQLAAGAACARARVSRALDRPDRVGGAAPCERPLSSRGVVSARVRVYIHAMPYTPRATRAGTRRDSPRPHSIRQGRGARSLASLKNARNLAIEAGSALAWPPRLVAARKSKRRGGSRREPRLPPLAPPRKIEASLIARLTLRKFD